jgi:hypothetical protein
LPSAQGLPREIPQLILKNADGSFRLQAGSARLDIVREADPISPSEAVDFFRLATQMSIDYLNVHQGKAGRVACIVHRAAADASPAITLSRHFCQQRWLDKPLNRPGDFELHAQKRFGLKGLFDVNSWVRCKTAISAKSAASSGANLILVEQDFNSLAEQTEERELSEDELRRFFEAAPQEMLRVLGLYFPTSS